MLDTVDAILDYLDVSLISQQASQAYRKVQRSVTGNVRPSYMQAQLWSCMQGPHAFLPFYKDRMRCRDRWCMHL
ncbi:hypothetical protein J6590_079227 [Homalodisca vitripennis]|nr:hypothetical protein J6590_079227 [Homalodisca vitripennis]